MKIKFQLKLFGIIFLTFLALKLTQVIDWSWWIIFAPLYFPIFVILFFGIIMILLFSSED